MKNIQIKKKICIGTANFSQRYGVLNKRIKKPYDLVEKLLEYNINSIDIADSYKLDKKTKKLFSKISCLEICAKVGSLAHVNNPYNYLLRYLKNLKKDFKCKKIKYLLLHDENDLLTDNGPKIYQALQNLKKKKIIDFLGVSIYDFNALKKILSCYDLDAIQCPFNIFDRRLLEKKFLNILLKKKIKIHVRSIFLQGFVFFKNAKVPNYLFKFKKYLSNWNKWIYKNKRNKVNIILSDLQKYKFINKIVIGVNSSDELHQILNYKKIKKIKLPIFNYDNNQILIKPYLWK